MLAASFVLLPLASHTLIRFLPGEPFSGALFFVRAELCHQFSPAERSWAFTRCAGKDPPAQEHLGSANESHISSSQERNFIYCLFYVLPQLHFRSLRNTCNSCTSFWVENNIQIEYGCWISHLFAKSLEILKYCILQRRIFIYSLSPFEWAPFAALNVIA